MAQYLGLILIGDRQQEQRIWEHCGQLVLEQAHVPRIAWEMHCRNSKAQIVFQKGKTHTYIHTRTKEKARTRHKQKTLVSVHKDKQMFAAVLFCLTETQWIHCTSILYKRPQGRGGRWRRSARKSRA